VPKLACAHLGMSSVNPPKPITLLGGLTSFGGAGNNYSMHALTAMVRELRKGTAKNGLVLCNGGVLSYQHVVVLSTSPRATGSPYPESNPLPKELPKLDFTFKASSVAEEHEAIIETYTVEFDRSGAPARGFVIGRLKGSGERFIANEADEATLKQLSSEITEPVGKTGWVKADKEEEGRTLFRLADGGKL
jgi:Thiolase-like protein type 1 additional C-terminal domain